MKTTTTFFAFVFFCTVCMAQNFNLSGHWTGFLGQDDKNYDFSMELDILQQGNIFTGTAKYVTGDGYAKYAIYNISGKISGDQLSLLDLDIVDENSNAGGSWYWCKKIGTARVTREGDSLKIAGSWENDNNQAYFGKELRRGYGCAPGVFKLTHFSPLRKIIPTQQPEKVITKQMPKVPLNAGVTTQSSSQKLTPSQSASKRNTKLKAIVEVESEDINLEFYDDNQVDGDTITVYFDNQLLIYKKQLSFSPLKCTVKIKRNKNHELIMFADNQGTFGENTAKLVVYEDGKVREISMHSNMQASQSLLFRRKDEDPAKP